MSESEFAPEVPPEATDEAPDEALARSDEETLEDRVIAAIRTVFDPEIPVNVYDLGLIYKLEIGDDGVVVIDMTLTSPMCPVAEILPQQVEQVACMVEGVADVELELVWDPPWHPGRLTEEVKLELGLL